VAANNDVAEKSSSWNRARSSALGRELIERRAGLGALAARICRSRTLQDDVAGRSYWHPNGFIKLVLEQRDGWGQLRLHVWPEATDDDDVHDHAWHYESVVVGGDLREIRYREAADVDTGGTPMWRHSYGMTGHRRFTLCDPEQVDIIEDPKALDWHTGDRSGGAPGHVHRFFPVTAPTVTMLRVGPILTRYSHVYRTDSSPQPVLAPRPTTQVDVAEWLSYVRAIAD
jgi:hypothetical protein